MENCIFMILEIWVFRGSRSGRICRGLSLGLLELVRVGMGMERVGRGLWQAGRSRSIRSFHYVVARRGNSLVFISNSLEPRSTDERRRGARRSLRAGFHCSIRFAGWVDLVTSP